jgi:hypothetical protein
MRKPRRPKPHVAWRDYPWLVQTLAVTGALAILGVLVALFVAIGQGPREVVTTSTPPVDSRDFLLGISGLAGVPVREGGTARLLDNGEGFFPELLRAIRGAKRSVTFSCYIWEEGKVSDDVVSSQYISFGAAGSLSSAAMKQPGSPTCSRAGSLQPPGTAPVCASAAEGSAASHGRIAARRSQVRSASALMRRSPSPRRTPRRELAFSDEARCLGRPRGR